MIVGLTVFVLFLVWAFGIVCYITADTRSNGWWKLSIGILGTALVLTFAIWSQIEEDYDRAVRKAEYKAYYEKCIIEVETKIQGELKFYSKTDNCLKAK